LLGNARNNEFAAVSAATAAMQWFGKHVSTIVAEFIVRSARRLYNATLVLFWNEFSAVLCEFASNSQLVPDEK
jgi:hypothetical protein